MKFGFFELLLIAGLVLLVCGPGRFGLVGRSLRKGVEEYRSETGKDSEK